MRLKLIGGTAGGHKCFVMRGEAAIRDREICGLGARRRWLGKAPYGQDHASQDKASLGERNRAIMALVPGPVAGAGLPGMVLAILIGLLGWRWKLKATAIGASMFAIEIAPQESEGLLI